MPSTFQDLTDGTALLVLRIGPVLNWADSKMLRNRIMPTTAGSDVSRSSSTAGGVASLLHAVAFGETSPTRERDSSICGNVSRFGGFTSAPTEVIMRTHLSNVVAGLLLLASVGAAAAQDVIVVAPEQETVIREYVVKQKVQPVELPSDFQVTIGTALPETVELYAIEAPDMDVKYRYVVVGNQTVLVEPETRKIIHIIE